ncbi:MAG: hypothetical protein AB7O96_05700 [Pseudobdellovibrionaceae bacterium]
MIRTALFSAAFFCCFVTVAAPVTDEVDNKILAFKEKASEKKDSVLKTWVELSADVQALQTQATNLVEQKLAIVLRNILLQELAEWEATLAAQKKSFFDQKQKESFEQILENLQWTPHLEKVLATQSKEAVVQLKEALGKDQPRQIQILSSRVRVEPSPLGMWDRILKSVGLQKEVSVEPILKTAFNNKSFQYSYFETYINRYLAFAVQSFNKSPYVSLEKALSPSLSEQIQKLKGEADAQTWYFLESIVQFNFEQPGAAVAPMTIRTVSQMESIQKNIENLEAPIEKAFALVVLYQVSRSWTERDVQLLKADLTTIEKLRLESARQSYYVRFKKWPLSIDALLSKGELKEAPWNFIEGKPLLFTASDPDKTKKQ